MEIFSFDQISRMLLTASVLTPPQTAKGPGCIFFSFPERSLSYGGLQAATTPNSNSPPNFRPGAKHRATAGKKKLFERVRMFAHIPQMQLPTGGKKIVLHHKKCLQLFRNSLHSIKICFKASHCTNEKKIHSSWSVSKANCTKHQMEVRFFLKKFK